MNELEFQWDGQKRLTNIKKHKIDFSDVVGLFYDNETLVIEDPEHYDEQRYLALGIDTKCRAVLVVHVYRDVDVIRIISARKADTKERIQFSGNDL